MHVPAPLPSVVVTNLHRRYTGVSATVAAVIPSQRRLREIALVDTGGLGLGGEVSLFQLVSGGWKPAIDRTEGTRIGCRILHARRDVDLILGWCLKRILRQPWRVVFTSDAPKKPGRVLQSLIDSADAVVATSLRAASFIGRHDYLIPHGVDTNWFSPHGDRPEAMPPQLSGRLLVGCFGRIRPSKGVDLFVKAMIECLPRHPDFSAVISGLCQPNDSDYLAQLQNQIAAAGLKERIVFIGDLAANEIPRWYRALSIYVAPSRSEGFGLTPFEAMASGIPVVTSTAGVWEEMIGDSFGRKFPNGSWNALEGHLEELMRSPELRASMGASARQQAEARFSVDAEACELEAVYRRELLRHAQMGH